MAGVSPNRMSQYGWMLGFMMAALSGVLLRRPRPRASASRP